MRTTLETEARAIRKMLGRLTYAIAVAAIPNDMTSKAECMKRITDDVSKIDREADEENDRHIDGRDEF